MRDFDIEQILRGWRLAGEDAAIGELMAGRRVPDVDLLVECGRTARHPAQREALGKPRLLWVPENALRPGPYGGLAVITSRASFSGANRHRRGTVRTLELFYKFREDDAALESAAVLAALVGLRNQRKAFHGRTSVAIAGLVKSLGFDCVQDIWARSSSAPMPIAMPLALKELSTRGLSADLLGRHLRQWHDVAFRRLTAVRATPVRQGFCAITLEDYEAVVGRYAEGLNKAHGETCWKTLSKSNLEADVWSSPRTQLMEHYGVSDVAIAKRCRLWGIAIPPRGYWQRLEAHVDPRPLLEKSGIEPPLDVRGRLARQFDAALCA